MIAIFILFLLFPNGIEIFQHSSNNKNEVIDSKNNEVQIIEAFNECMNEDISDETLQMTSERKNLTNYFSRYNVSILYKNLDDSNEYKYNPYTIYYSASTIKIVDALYVYENALLNLINLNNPLAVIQRSGLASSTVINKTNINTMPIKDVVKYLISLSDNRAHQLLIYNYGYKNINNFSKSLGTTFQISASDYYTNINIHDAEIYLTELYNFFKENSELGSELMSYFINDNNNLLKLSDVNINFAHKFGYFDNYFNDIGIVFDKYPYLIAVLTKEANRKEIITDISRKIYEFHTLYYQNKSLLCSQIHN